MSIESSIAAAKGIEPCPICGSADVRWRGRRLTDFVLTWLRWAVEFFAGLLRVQSRVETREEPYWGTGPIDTYEAMPAGSSQTRADIADEVREANTGHKTPMRFWNCIACQKEGHVF